MNSVFLSVNCFLIILSSISVVTSRNALHSILFLVSSFFFSSITIFFLENEFFALFFLIIYLGAIMVLFLFVVMMLDLKHNKLKINRLHLPTGVFLGFISFLYVKACLNDFLASSHLLKISPETTNYYVNWQTVLEQSSDVTVLGEVFYHNYVVQILMSGLLLYTTTIGVVFLTSNKHKPAGIKNKQSLTKQLSRSHVL